MAELSGNQCTIITIIPMEVECNVTNASTPTSPDGSAIVQVFGGTPPYLITWNNGQQGNTLTNLLPGTYSATVVDYFGDYVVTTECVVESASQVAYQFDSCPGFAAQTIYVSGSTYEPPFPSFKPTIIFNEILGCYDFIGTVNSSGLEVSALTISNSYSNCTACNPPTPTPPTQDTLCLTGSDDISTIQYEFAPDGVDSNGNFKWINTTYGLTMSYNVNKLRWEVLTWTSLGTVQPYLGIMIQPQSPPSLQPLGAWINAGNVGGQKWLWNVATGPCPSDLSSVLSLSVTPISPQCEGQLGTVLMNANGGSSPYSYIILGITSSQTSGLFPNVEPNSYVGQVTDSLGNTATANFTINYGQNLIPYTIQLLKSNEAVNNTSSGQLVSYQYDVTITPQLPPNVQVSFDLEFTHIRTSTYPDNSSDPVSYENTVTGSLDGNEIPISSTVPVVLSGPPSENCQDSQIDISTFSSTSDTSITIDDTSTFSGKVTTTVSLPFVGSGSCSCPITGLNKTNVQLKNVVINGGTSCESINNISSTITGESTESGCPPLP